MITRPTYPRWWLNEPIRLPLRSPSFCLYKFLPLYTCATPFILLSYSIVTFDLSSRSYLPFHSHRYIVDSREVKPRGGALFPKVFLNFQKEGEIYGNRIFSTLVRKHVPCQQKKTFYNRCCNSWNRASLILLTEYAGHALRSSIKVTPNCELCTPFLPVTLNRIRNAVTKFRLGHWMDRGNNVRTKFSRAIESSSHDQTRDALSPKSKLCRFALRVDSHLNGVLAGCNFN